MSSELLPFEVASGSMVGRLHRAIGRNNQDAVVVRRGPWGLVALVADGCGSGHSSEVGARLGLELLAAELERALREEIPLDPELLQRAGDAVRTELGRIASLAGFTWAEEALLFTILGVVVAGERAVVLTLGDGLVVCNGETTVLGPFPGNAPPYFAHSILDRTREVPWQLRWFDAAELHSVVLGTDGAAELWTSGVERNALSADDRLFRNPDLLRRRLFQLSRAGQAGLDDDATLVVVRRPTGARA